MESPIWRRFNTRPELIQCISIAPARPLDVVSTRTGLRKYLAKERNSPGTSTNMKRALGNAISELGTDDPQTAEECEGRRYFGGVVMDVVRRYFEGGDLEDIDNHAHEGYNDAGYWQVLPAPSNRSKCTLCKQDIRAGSLRIDGGAALVANQGNRPIGSRHHDKCFFEWLGQRRRANTKGLRECEDLKGFEKLTAAEQHMLRNSLEDAKQEFLERHGQRPPSTSEARTTSGQQVPVPKARPLPASRAQRTAVEGGKGPRLIFLSSDCVI